MLPVRTFSFFTENAEAGNRLDAVIASRISECSRSLAVSLIRDGRILVSGQRRKPGYRLQPADEIRGEIPLPEPPGYLPEPIPLDILYEDAQMIVINKASDLVVHPAPGHPSGTLVNALLHHCPDLEGIGGEMRPGIIHRLDKDTTGVLAVAKNAEAVDHLSRQFKERTVKKKYVALILGIPKTRSGEISLPIGRHPVHRKRMSARSRNGKPALTRWKILEHFYGVTLVSVDLFTGRTHQIRVHMSAMGHPVMGDSVYKGKMSGTSSAAVMAEKASRQMLHAARLELTHPKTRERMVFEAPLPDDMRRIIRQLKDLQKSNDSTDPEK